MRADIETIVRRIRASYPGALHYAEVWSSPAPHPLELNCLVV